ncbi:hypothetical protein BC830DRAFT_657382 [Chytriomyces sp. MP71]|nr:hypothetical protein BC830DRAFT_657382 [Chytriomyces sp. MP71]
MIEMILMDGTFHVEFHLLERLKKKLLNITRVEEMFKFRKGTEASAAPGADAASKKRKMTPLIVAGVVLLLAIVAISTGIVVSKNNANNATASSNSAAAPSSSSGATAQGGSSSASNSTGNTGNGTTTAPNTGIKSNRQLIGYLGANAVANGVDIKNGISARKTDTGDYQRRLAYYCDLGYYGTINLSFMNAFGGM